MDTPLDTDESHAGETGQQKGKYTSHASDIGSD